MKKFVLFIFLLASLPLLADHVDPVTARKVATTFLNNNGAKSVQLTDLSKEAGFPNLYIFNGNPGFVVMAADDCVQPILGYSLTGKFVAENMPSNVSGWLQEYDDEIQYGIDSKVKATAETALLWKELINGNSKAGRTTIVVDALVQTTWDQDPLYNIYCPYDSNAGELTVTGCVATAMAQIMRYWEYPTQGKGSHSYTHSTYGAQSANFGSTTYDWANMPLSLSNLSSTEQIDAVATLMYHCGVSVEMDYGISANGGSGAVTGDVANALKNYFNYQTCTYREKNSYSSTWVNLLKTELNASRPMQYKGRGDGGGHSFVCDGYDSSDNFHFNWGWSGKNDGFYALTNLVPGSGGSGGAGYSFTQSQGAIFGIQPKACTASAPSNLNVTTEGRNNHLTWSGTTNAASYSVYRDGVMIANTTSTVYSDNNLAYGSYDYYVKSRDANGASSSPTGTISATVEPIPTNLTVTKNGDGATFDWTEPEWCVPTTDNEVLTYGDGTKVYRFGSGNTTTQLYFGHKYPSSMLSANKALYKVSFNACVTGNFTLYVYTSSTGANHPQNTVLQQSVVVTESGWFDIALNERLPIDETKDLWVFIYDADAHDYPMGAGEPVGSDNNGNYTSRNPTSSVSTQSVVMLIRTYIADDDFFYNLYDNNIQIASNLTGDTYSISNVSNNAAHEYTLKTVFNNGETSASNIAGLSLGTVTIGSLSLDENDKMTVTQGSTLTVSGTFINNDPERLIIEDGAQLVHSSDNVQATVKKAITAYTSNANGWYTIATPFATAYNPANNNLLSGTYDLYAYDEDAEFEWVNYRSHSSSFSMGTSTGYLYANSPAVTLAMTGTLNNGNYTETINLSYANTDPNIQGYNLLGNPTAHSINFTTTGNVSTGYYYLNNSSTWIYEATNTVPAGRGFLVKANALGQSVTLNPQLTRSDDMEAQGKASLVVDIDGQRAYIQLSEAVPMPLLDFHGRHSSVYLTRSGKPYIMLTTDDTHVLDLSYEPKNDGQHTLSVNTEDLKLNYLHLIDNLTGADIDLLTTPSYTFTAKTEDYSSRFKLMLSPNSNTTQEDEPFAFVSNGNIIVNGTTNNTMLQIIDMTGRVVLRKNGTCLISTEGMAPGVYVLQLTTENYIKNQKITINNK